MRPKLGHEVSDTQIGLIETSIKMWDEVSSEEQRALDALMAKKNRFFSIFDQSTRLAMYRHCRVHRHKGKDLVIMRDVEESDEIHILLRGNIHIVQINDELDIQLRLASLRAGEVCGDQSIQRKYRDPLKILSVEWKTAVTNSDDTITVSISKEKFMGALFQEMSLELFYKIILLRNTSFFEELSPYSLMIIASNVEVREVKYGEVIVQQGYAPDAMYILAFGSCKTIYQYVDQKSTKVSKFANKCLRSDLPKPMHTGLHDYRSIPHQQRRRKEGESEGVDRDATGQLLKTKTPSAERWPASKPKLRQSIQEKLNL